MRIFLFHTFLVLTVSMSAQDLVVSNVSSANSTVVAGSTLSISNIISNFGSIDVGNFTIGYYLSEDFFLSQAFNSNSPSLTPFEEDLHLGTINVLGGLQAGAITLFQTYNMLNPIILPKSVPSGNYRLFVWVDDTESISETNETNNYTSIPLTVTGLPDLKFTSTRVYFESLFPFVPKSYPRSASIQMSATVTNADSDDSSNASRVGYYLSTDNVWDANDEFLEPKSFPSLTPGSNAFVQETIRIPANTGPGNYWLFTVIDDRLELPEEDETNNRYSFEIIVTSETSKPDLEVSSVSIQPSSVTEGDPFESDIVIRNLGQAPAPSGLELAVFLSEDATFQTNGQDISLSTNPHIINQTIQPGATVNVNDLYLNIPPNVTSTTKNWTLFYVANFFENIDEDNLSNNIFSKTIEIKNSGGVIGGGPGLFPLSVRDFNYEEVTQTAFSVYPNPSIDVLNIVFPEKADYSLYLINSDGKIGVQEEVISKKVYELDVSSVSSGIYVLRVTSDKGVVRTKKVLIR